MSCLKETKYLCIKCLLPICNLCSVPELVEATPGWVAGKKVGYCHPCKREFHGESTKQISCNQKR